MLRSDIAYWFPKQTDFPKSIIEEQLFKRVKWVLQKSLVSLIKDANNPSYFQTVRGKKGGILQFCSDCFDQYSGCFGGIFPPYLESEKPVDAFLMCQHAE